MSSIRASFVLRFLGSSNCFLSNGTRAYQTSSGHALADAFGSYSYFRVYGPKCPAFCLAQPIGLGCSVQLVVRDEGPAIC